MNKSLRRLPTSNLTNLTDITKTTNRLRDTQPVTPAMETEQAPYVHNTSLGEIFKELRFV